MPVKVQTICLDKTRRIFCVSDIHGHFDLFYQALRQVNFQKEDQCIVLGDIVEKGPDSLKTVRFLMDLQQKQDIYVTKGNCEAWVLELLEDEETLARYMQSRKESIFWEMFEEIGGDFAHLSDFVQKIKHIYQKEFSWLDSLPVILDDEQMTFVHAGIQTETLEDNDFELCLTYPTFELSAPILHKYVMVGHLPTVNYCHQYPDCNPRINHEKKIISIDGGIGVKPDGQLNLVTIEDLKKKTISSISLSEAIPMTMQKEQKASEVSRSINWLDNQIEVLSEDQKGYWISHCSSQYRMHVSKDMVFDDQTRVYDVTDYQLPIQKGDQVLVYRETPLAYYAKKDGILGWVLK